MVYASKRYNMENKGFTNWLICGVAESDVDRAHKPFTTRLSTTGVRPEGSCVRRVTTAQGKEVDAVLETGTLWDCAADDTASKTSAHAGKPTSEPLRASRVNACTMFCSKETGRVITKARKAAAADSSVAVHNSAIASGTGSDRAEDHSCSRVANASVTNWLASIGRSVTESIRRPRTTCADLLPLD